MGIAAAVALLAVVSYQNGILIPQLRHEISQAEAPASFSPQFIAETRSESHDIDVLPTQRTVDLVFSKNPLWTSSTYSCELKSAETGRSVFTANVGVPEGDEWGLSFPAKGLRSGTYVLRVAGVKPVPDASEITQYQFKLNVK